jgi:hypothetical protein
MLFITPLASSSFNGIPLFGGRLLCAAKVG